IHQHFNADAARPAGLISCTNRIYKNCGLNDLEQIEDAPEYDPNVVLTAELVKDYLTARASAPAWGERSRGAVRARLDQPYGIGSSGFCPGCNCMSTAVSSAAVPA